MNGYRIKDALYHLAGPEDDAAIRTLLNENGMPSWVSVALQREPSYFKGASLMGENFTFLARKADEHEKVIGMYACTYMPVHVNGKPESAGYFGGMRLGLAYRQKPRYIRQGFDALPHLHDSPATLPLHFTSIAGENRPARRLMEANLSGMPRYTPCGEMTTMVFSVRRGEASGLLRPAGVEDIPEMAVFYNAQVRMLQFSPVLSEAWLESLDGSTGLKLDDFFLLRDGGGQLRAMLALWDQRAFKQSVVTDYRTPLRQLRPLYNLFARGTRRVELPAVGEALQSLFIAFFACDEAWHDQAAAILREAASLAEVKGANSAVLGLASKHPLLPGLLEALKPSLYRTVIETVTLKDARPCALEHPCAVQPEVALL